MDRKVQVKLKKVKLAEVRRRLELTQEEAAQQLGIDQASLSRLESDKRVPSWIYTAVRLHHLLKEAGYSLEDLALPPREPGDGDN